MSNKKWVGHTPTTPEDLENLRYDKMTFPIPNLELVASIALDTLKAKIELFSKLTKERNSNWLWVNILLEKALFMAR